MIVQKDIDRIYVFTDTHFGYKNSSIAWRNDQTGFLREFLCENLKSDGFDPERSILLVLGDIFHSRESINTMIGTMVKDEFKNLATIFKRGIYLLVGNHDGYFKDTNEVNSLNMIFEDYDNIHIIANPTNLILSNETSTVKSMLLPWTSDHEKMRTILTEDDSAYLFGHLDITGFKYNRHIKIKEGSDPNVFKQYKRVYSGHIHIRQTVGNITYIGSPYQMDRGDIGNDKGYYILHNVNGILHEQFILNTVSPRFIECDALDVFQMNAEQLRPILNNNYIDINISTAVARFINMDEMNKFLSANNIVPRRFEFQPYVQETIGDIDTIVIDKNISISTIGKTFLTNLNTYNELEMNNIMSYFDDLYIRAKNKIN